MGDSAIATAQAANAPKVTPPASGVSLIYENMSPHLITTFSLCNDDGSVTEDLSIVQALFLDGDQNIESQWQTPFENSNPEQKLPTLMASIQSGQLSNTLGVVADAVGLDSVTQSMQDGLKSLKNKTNLTKVNTRQVFLSTASVRLNITIGFVAISDAKAEVENQISLLQQWALPQSLASESVINGSIQSKSIDLFPSTIPPFVALTLHGKTYKPMIIESVQAPLNCPIDSHGNRLSAQVHVSLMSLTAWDKKDVISLYGG